MKKLFLAAVMMIGFAGISFAQTAKPADTKAKKPAATSATKSTVAATPATTPATKPAAKASPATAAKPVASKDVVLKKDGTPDKRYKAAPKTTGPTKKDGTPDKRFKENKKP